MRLREMQRDVRRELRRAVASGLPAWAVAYLDTLQTKIDWAQADLRDKSKTDARRDACRSQASRAYIEAIHLLAGFQRFGAVKSPAADMSNSGRISAPGKNLPSATSKRFRT